MREVTVERLAVGDFIYASDACESGCMVGGTVTKIDHAGVAHHHRVETRGGRSINTAVGYPSTHYVLDGKRFTVR